MHARAGVKGGGRDTQPGFMRSPMTYARCVGGSFKLGRLMDWPDLTVPFGVLACHTGSEVPTAREKKRTVSCLSGRIKI